ncbi:hypothetical protein I6M90_13730 [Acinetobacter bereziniae]|uniref:hypothetical protein n=1 Tax=Acinetobacter bereziniae TaxID=106648 RepID=UPI001901C150|nr:hypothetical protein [Acinetobacter bereziniae]MBJ8452967.1 hypothetical protein [Acinetobacter bereziniae]MBJ8457118.1 hypothetical protein [Acinetobacter bereziniae]
MSLKSDGNYELKFINESEFEIICLDYRDTYSLRKDLDKEVFISAISSVDGRDELHLQKILGKTSSKENLIALLDDWFKRLAKYEVEAYTDI